MAEWMNARVAWTSSQLSAVWLGRYANAHRLLGLSNKLALHGRSRSPGETCCHDVLPGCHVDSNSLSFSKTGQALALYENVNTRRRTWVVSGVSGEDEPGRSLRGRREDCRIVDAIPRYNALLCSGERA